MSGGANQRKILIVDDEESVGRMLRRILKRMHRECEIVASAEAARLILKSEAFDLILCDIRLPGESGIDLIQYLITEYPDMAAVMISGVDDPGIIEKALEIGVYGYIVKPFNISEVIINVSSALRRQKLEIERRDYRIRLEEMVADRTARLRQALDAIIRVVAQTVEMKDPYTAGHQQRTANLAKAIAKEMGGSDDFQTGVYMAGMIHDLGKISIPTEILSKPTKLTALEFSLIKMHSQTGYDILKDIPFPWPIARIILQHHERLNGSGYPQGLSNSDILPEAKILSVADVVEAMASNRPYRPGWGINKALEEISQNKNRFYDPQVVDACVMLFQEKGFSFQ